MTGFFLGRARITLRARFSQDSAHVDAGVGDETAQPCLDRVGDYQERQAAGDLVEGAGFRFGDAKTERREDCRLRLGQVREHAFDLVRPVVQWHRLAHGRLLLCGFCSPQRWSFFARESTFSYTPTEKCKAVSNERGIVRTPAPRASTRGRRLFLLRDCPDTRAARRSPFSLKIALSRFSHRRARLRFSSRWARLGSSIFQDLSRDGVSSFAPLRE